MSYTLEEIKQLEIEMDLPAGKHFIDHVRELELLREQAQLFFRNLREIILLTEEVYQRENNEI
jgi:hypothetical protein